MELEDRFGPLPEPARNLMLQLRFKVLARGAAVRSILVENGQLVLHVDWIEKSTRAGLQLALQDLGHVGARSVRVAMEGDWQERLRTVLEVLRRQRGG